MRELIGQFVDEKREELLDLLARLVAARTENPPGNEHLAAEVLEDYFRRHAIPFERREAEPGRTNIIGRVGEGTPRLLIACHLDVVPAGEGWMSDPFHILMKEDKVFGRGVSDNKGPAAAMSLAGRFLKEHENELSGTVLLAGVADEERGSRLGLDFLTRDGELSADMAIVPDIAHNMQKIGVAEKGVVFIELISHGRQAHGSRPEQGINAIWNLMKLLEALREEKIPSPAHALLTPPTLNLGMIHGGSAPNMVPARCTAQIDIRFLPGAELEDVLRVVRKTVARVQSELKEARFELNVISSLPPTEAPAEHPLVRALAESAREMCGIEAKPAGISGATVCKQLLARGIMAVGFGAGDPGQAHAANECIEISQLLGLAKVLALASLKLCGRR